MIEDRHGMTLTRWNEWHTYIAECYRLSGTVSYEYAADVGSLYAQCASALYEGEWKDPEDHCYTIPNSPFLLDDATVDGKWT